MRRRSENFAGEKREPLPKFGAGTLLVELPELFEATYRTAKQIADFRAGNGKAALAAADPPLFHRPRFGHIVRPVDHDGAAVCCLVLGFQPDQAT